MLPAIKSIELCGLFQTQENGRETEVAKQTLISSKQQNVGFATAPSAKKQL